MSKRKTCSLSNCRRAHEDSKMIDYLEKLIMRTQMFLREEIQILKTFKPNNEIFSDINEGCEGFLLLFADFFAVVRLARGNCPVNLENSQISKFLSSLNAMYQKQNDVRYKVEKAPLNPSDEMEIDIFVLSQIFQSLLTITDKQNQEIRGGCLSVNSEEIVFFVDCLLTAKTEKKGRAFCFALNKNYMEHAPQIPLEVKCAMVFYYIQYLNGRSLASINDEGEVCFKFVLPRYRREFQKGYIPIKL